MTDDIVKDVLKHAWLVGSDASVGRQHLLQPEINTAFAVYNTILVIQ